MSIIPKKTKFRLSFRNKLKTHDRKLSVFNQLSKLCKSTNAYRLLSKKKINTHTNVFDFYKSAALTQFLEKKRASFASEIFTKKTNVQQNKIVPKLINETHLENAAQLIFTPDAKKNAYVAHWPNSFKLQQKKINLKVKYPCLHFSKHNLLNVKSFNNCIKQNKSLQQTTHQLLKQQIQQNFAVDAHAYNSCLLFGQYGICFEQNGTLSAKFIETVRLICARKLKKKGRCWLRICCQTAVTARPAETRMGKGKGAISFWQAKVYTGQMFFEFSGLSQSTLNEIFNNLCKKSPLKLKLIGA